MAGVPFDRVHELATVKTSEAARQLIVRQREFGEAKAEVERLLHSRRHNLSREQFRAWRKTTRAGAEPPADPAIAPFTGCLDSYARLIQAQTRFHDVLDQELNFARTALLASAQTILPAYLVFAGQNLRDATANAVRDISGKRTRKERARERHLLLYLQRVAAKNDSLSEFGPCGWGRVSDQTRELAFAPRLGIAARETFPERWAAHAACAAMNADPEVRGELAPRIHPNGRLDGSRFVFTDTGDTVPVDPPLLNLLKECYGRTPVYSLGGELADFEELANRKMIRWEVEVPALEPYALDVLIGDIERWRDGPVRGRWLDRLRPIASLAAEFGSEQRTTERMRIMDEANAGLEHLGIFQNASSRFLYAATNPIGEECVRDCEFSIGRDLIDEVATDAAPWIDLWRDNYAFVASRVAAGLRGVFEKAAPARDAMPLPAFLKSCQTANLPLVGPGLVALAAIAFQEVKTAFRAQMQKHAHKDEHELTADDCHFIRQKFEYAKFDEYTFPSADIQLAAASIDAVANGQYQWILAELHPPVALLHHGFYWGCPDKNTLTAALAETALGRPNFHFGFFAADFTATTSVHLFDLPGNLCHFVAPQRGNPAWHRLDPSETEVYVEKTTGDVCLRRINDRQHLGSFARNWIIPLGFHPFYLSLGDSSPRLRCGKVVVQRRGWTVRLEELGAGDFTGISRDLVLAVEKLRAAKDLPRHVYIRPAEQVLRRSGGEGRDKDTKPVYIDFESYLFLEIFHRWLTKAGELEIIEMLPAPDDLLWQEADGRRTFELRTQILPRS